MIGLMDAMAEGLADGGAETLPERAGAHCWQRQTGRWHEDTEALYRERRFIASRTPILVKPMRGLIGGVLDSRQHGAAFKQ
jgi:hypothetical protein